MLVKSLEVTKWRFKMALVDKDHMTELRPASDAKSTAETAADDVQLMALAHAINSASNCGEYRTVFQENISAENKKELESKGYVLKAAGIADSERGTIISWK